MTNSNVDFVDSDGKESTCPSDPLTIYKMGNTIGSGGHGIVYEVTDISDNKQYVLKLPKIHQEKYIVKEIKNQLLMKNEWQIPEDSPIVLSTCEYMSPDEDVSGLAPWISFPYYPSGDLFSHVRTRRVELSQLESMGRDILHALKLIHDSNYVLNDLKMENIVIYYEHERRRLVQRAKLIDLGLMDPVEKISIAGTLEYMAPEKLLLRLKQKGFKTGKASDMWSFGVLMFTAYSKMSPFRSKKERIIEMNIDLVSQILNSFQDEILASPKLSEDHKKTLLKYYGKNSVSTVPHINCNEKDAAYIKCTELSDLISKVLRFNPDARLTAEQALAHKFFH